MLEQDRRLHERHGHWDSAFDTSPATLKTLQAALDKQTSRPQARRDRLHLDRRYRLRVPGRRFRSLSAEVGARQDISIGKSPEGKSLKFVHRGSYDNMDNTYEAITNHLDEKKLEAKDSFIEEYVTDPLKTAEDKLIINVYVPLK